MTQSLNPSYPVLPLRDIVVFPHMIVPLFVGRDKSVRALEEQDRRDALERQARMTTVSEVEEPGGSGLAVESSLGGSRGRPIDLTASSGGSGDEPASALEGDGDPDVPPSSSDSRCLTTLTDGLEIKSSALQDGPAAFEQLLSLLQFTRGVMTEWLLRSGGPGCIAC